MSIEKIAKYLKKAVKVGELVSHYGIIGDYYYNNVWKSKGKIPMTFFRLGEDKKGWYLEVTNDSKAKYYIDYSDIHNLFLHTFPKYIKGFEKYMDEQNEGAIKLESILQRYDFSLSRLPLKSKKDALDIAKQRNMSPQFEKLLNEIEVEIRSRK